jgi:hypothetical protein
MFTSTKCALTIALILGAASTAMAGDQTDERGGYVMPGSMDGVNPVLHPDILGNAGKAYGYGYVASPTRQEDPSKSGRKGRNH